MTVARGTGSTGEFPCLVPPFLALTRSVADGPRLCRGCVSGKQLENLRDYIAVGGEAKYDFDMIDGYDELEGE